MDENSPDNTSSLEEQHGALRARLFAAAAELDQGDRVAGHDFVQSLYESEPSLAEIARRMR